MAVAAPPGYSGQTPTEGQKFTGTDKRQYVFRNGQWITAGSDIAQRGGNSDFARDAGGVVGAAGGSVVAAGTMGAINKANKQTNTDAAHARRQGELLDEKAALQGKYAQRGEQIANRDPMVEAQKLAGSKAAAQFGQTQSQMSGASGGGGAAIAAMNVQDPSGHVSELRARSDEQAQRGALARDAQKMSQQGAEERRAYADGSERYTTDVAIHNSESARLSDGPEGGGNLTPEDIPTDTGIVEETPEETPEDVPENQTPVAKAQRIDAAYEGAPPAAQEALAAARSRLAAAQNNPDKAAGIAEWNAIAQEINSQYAGQNGWPGIATSESASRKGLTGQAAADYDPRFEQGAVRNSQSFDAETERRANAAAQDVTDREVAGWPKTDPGGLGRTANNGQHYTLQNGEWVPDPGSDSRIKNIISAINRRFF